ncbi:MAG: carboxypeptidase regulatory-like domain-containing protein, partial [Delftia sp.]|nr:carboxypeptidase regulatory-like domain-containing protein [Delftia sp.]
LQGVPVSAVGEGDAPSAIYLPLILKQSGGGSIASHSTTAFPARARLQTTSTYSAITDASGYFSFTVPPGAYTVTVSSDVYTGDRRKNVAVQAHEVTLLSTVRILPLDPQVTEIGAEGGTAANSVGLSSTLEIAPGVLASTTPLRVTYMSPSELPGSFNGYIPQAFSDFKPDGPSPDNDRVMPFHVSQDRMNGRPVVWTMDDELCGECKIACPWTPR